MQSLPADPAPSSNGPSTPSSANAPDPPSTIDNATTPQQDGATEVIKAETIEVIVNTAANDAAQAADAKLRILLPTGDLFDRDLFHSDVQLGKGPRNDIVIADPAVSSAHAIIGYENGNYSIRDLGSRNGTYVDGERITEPHVLQHGDVIGIGLSKLTFRSSAYDRTADFLETTLVTDQVPPPLTEQSLAKAVVASGLAKQPDIDQLSGPEAKGRRLYRALSEGGLVTESALRDLMSRTFHIPTLDLETSHVDGAVAARLSAELARKHQVLAVGEEGGSVILAVADPTDTEAIEAANGELGGKVSTRLATASQISTRIEQQYAPKLIGVLPSGEKLEYPITQHETNIGKAAHNHIVLTDPTVSNAHAILIMRGGGYSIADLGSRNGTFVNSEKLGPHAHVLRHGDTIQLGQTVLTFRNTTETEANVTAVLSPEVLDEIKKRAAAATGEGPTSDGVSGQPLAAAAAGGAPAVNGKSETDAEKKKKKKKGKEGKDERLRAAYISGVSRILAQVIAVLMSVGLALYLTRKGSEDKPVLETNSKGKAKLKIASPGIGTAFDGAVYEASGVVQVPG
ncbi:MAG TPA: FHA domain-containing protein, partial [Blastocatellia bacterium]|nr:FHA domain-containing protein [Blastocatellia bacterium]